MNNKHKKGDLVFIPSSVRLIQFSDNDVSHAGLPLFINKHTTTIRPRHALLMDNSLDTYCKVYYNGEYWFACKSDIYEGSQ
tara:strand:+ start:169 stop:411 length:243 start_codon:yes stop_codon:yes gene_type:complete